MDGKCRWMDDVFIERFWKNVKYDDVYIKFYGSMKKTIRGLSQYFKLYNEKGGIKTLTRRRRV
jgi:putative transposase